MATLTAQGSVNGYGSTATVSAYTPAASTLQLLTVYTHGAQTISSITGHGTWTYVNDIFTANRRVSVYALISSATTSSSTVEVTFSAATSHEVVAIEATGADNSSVANVIVQSATASFYHGSGGPHTESVTLSAFGSATNTTFITTGVNAGTTTAEAGYTELYNGTRAMTAYLASEDTSPSWTTSQNFTTTRAVALEIKEAAGGGIGVTQALGQINYSAQPHIIQLAGTVAVSQALGQISYSANNHAIQLAGTVEISQSLGSINYIANNHSVQLAGIVGVAQSLGQISYTAQSHNIQLAGGINVATTLGQISYSAQNHTITLQGTIQVPQGLGQITYAVQTHGVLLQPEAIITINHRNLISVGRSDNSTVVQRKANNVTISRKNNTMRVH